MHTQPWVSRDNPLGHLWMRALFEAVDSGFIKSDYIQEHVERGWVRPSLMFQVGNRIENSAELPRKARALDDFFVPPYKRLQQASAPAQSPPQSSEPLLGRMARTLRGAMRRGR
jgi:hypothetical protein